MLNNYLQTSSDPRPYGSKFSFIFLALLAFYFWFSGNLAAFIWCSGYSIIIFRAELALLMGIIILFELYHARISLLTAFLHAVCAGITSLGENNLLLIMVNLTDWPYNCFVAISK